MPIVKDGALIEDAWTRLDDDADLVVGPVIVSLTRWQEQREILAARNAPLGIVLASDEKPEAIADDFGRFDLVCLEFPKFTDGRAYSHARKLRERLGYAGELRAVGEVLRDQYLFMQRCGFDAFELSGDATLDDWLRATSEISVAYQRPPRTGAPPRSVSARSAARKAVPLPKR